MTAAYLQLIARVTTDATIKTTTTGKSFYSFTVVADLKKNEPLWVNATLWPGKADSAAQFIKKRAILFLVGIPQFKIVHTDVDPKIRTYLSVDCVRVVRFADDSPKEETNLSETHSSNDYMFNQESPTVVTMEPPQNTNIDWELPF